MVPSAMDSPIWGMMTAVGHRLLFVLPVVSPGRGARGNRSDPGSPDRRITSVGRRRDAVGRKPGQTRAAEFRSLRVGDNMNESKPDSRSTARSSPVSCCSALGILFVLESLGWIEAGSRSGEYWPLILIVVGHRSRHPPAAAGDRIWGDPRDRVRDVSPASNPRRLLDQLPQGLAHLLRLSASTSSGGRSSTAAAAGRARTAAAATSASGSTKARWPGSRRRAACGSRARASRHGWRSWRCSAGATGGPDRRLPGRQHQRDLRAASTSTCARPS